MAACDRRIRVAEVPHGLVGEHDAPAEGVVRTVALVDLDARRGSALRSRMAEYRPAGPPPRQTIRFMPGSTPRCSAYREFGVCYIARLLQVSINISPENLDERTQRDRPPNAVRRCLEHPDSRRARRRNHRRTHTSRRSDHAAGIRDADDPAAAAVRALQAVLAGGDLPLRRARARLVLEQHRLR